MDATNLKMDMLSVRLVVKKEALPNSWSRVEVVVSACALYKVCHDIWMIVGSSPLLDVAWFVAGFLFWLRLEKRSHKINVLCRLGRWQFFVSSLMLRTTISYLIIQRVSKRWWSMSRRCRIEWRCVVDIATRVPPAYAKCRSCLDRSYDVNFCPDICALRIWLWYLTYQLMEVTQNFQNRWSTAKDFDFHLEIFARDGRCLRFTRMTFWSRSNDTLFSRWRCSMDLYLRKINIHLKTDDDGNAQMSLPQDVDVRRLVSDDQSSIHFTFVKIEKIKSDTNSCSVPIRIVSCVFTYKNMKKFNRCHHDPNTDKNQKRDSIEDILNDIITWGSTIVKVAKWSWAFLLTSPYDS